MSDIDQQEFNAGGAAEEQKPEAGADERSEQEKEADRKLADRLSQLIEHANEKCVPLCNMIRKVRFQSPLIHAFIQLTDFVGQHFDHIDAQKEEDRDENELIKAVKPLLQQAETILNETNGAIRGADPDNRLSNKAKRNVQDHKATPEEQRLAEAVKVVRRFIPSLFHSVLTCAVFSTAGARSRRHHRVGAGQARRVPQSQAGSRPPARRPRPYVYPAISPLAARCLPCASVEPLTQIVGGVGLLLAGVLNLVGKLLSGLGLDSLLKGIMSATGLDKIYKGLGLDKWLKM
jgi:hypothetical protein